MKLRSNLLMLVAGTILPVLALTLGFGYLLVRHEIESFQQAAMDRNRAFVSAVDAEVRGQINSIELLAASPALSAGDLRAFDGEARRALRSQPDWQNVVLSDRSRQLVNALVPFDPRGLPPPVETETIEHAFATGSAVVGGVTQGRAVRALGVPIRLPVVREGKVRYVLTAVIRADRVAQLMEEQRYPKGWASGILDAKLVFIARIPARAPGQQGSPDLRRAIASMPEGWFRGTTLEGVDTYTAHLTSPLTGWTVAVAIPTSEVFGVARRAAWTLGLGGLACLVLAIGFAYYMGRRITRPMSELAASARALGTGMPVHPVDHAYEEIQEVARALESAAAAIGEREALRESERIALQEADRAKDEFLAMLGHELRNPLSAISGAASVLRIARPGEDNALRAHGVIDRQTRQMKRLVDDLLDVSRLEMGKVTLKSERLELGEFAARVVGTWRDGRRLPVERVQLKVATAWVDGDRARLEQVVCNLLDNADKFSRPDTPISVTVRAEGDGAELEVADLGEGIPRELLDRVFDLFVQGAQKSDRARGGMGLGLTLVRKLLELHGGTIGVSSEGPGKGARFTVRLPAVEPGAEEAVRSGEAGRRAESRRILLVEDNADGRAMIETLLQLEGHTVRAVATGEAALALVADWIPEVVIVDIGLPDVDGYEVARRLRQGPCAAARLIALTGYGQEKDQRLAHEAGFDLHLTKPVDVQSLHEAITLVTAKDRALDR